MALRSIKEQLRRIPNHGLGYVMLRYLGEQSEAADALGALPQAEVSFNYQGQFADEGAGEWRIEPFGLKRSPHALRRYLVEINGSVAAGALRFTFGYSENVHDRSTMQILADAFVEELHVLIEHCESRDRPAFTPSDFRLAGLNQTELDRVLAVNKQVSDIYPLAPLQQGMLFHALYSAHYGEYVVQTMITLPGDLQHTAFREAWQRVVQRHAILRSSFVYNGLSEPIHPIRLVAITPPAGYVVTGFNSAGESDPSKAKSAFGF